MSDENEPGGPGEDPNQGVGLEEMSPDANDDVDVMPGDKTAADLEAVFDVPVRISAVLGRTRIPVANLLKLDVGSVLELDRQVGEAIDIYVNDRLVARGEIVLVENKLGITMTEIIKAG